MSGNQASSGWYEDGQATLGDRIAAAREAARLTPREFSERLGVKESTVERWENDVADPRANRVQMMAGLLGVSLSWLLTGRGEGPDGPVEAPEVDADVLRLLDEMRALQVQIERTAARMAQVEKALRRKLREAA